MNEDEKISHLMKIDPTNAVSDGLRWIKRYREATARHHGLIFDAWKGGDHDRALVELHFMLIGVQRTVLFMRLIGSVLEGSINEYVVGEGYQDYIDARNHFEHIEDRLHGSHRNAPQPVTDGANPRTIHFGLDGSSQSFLFGVKSIDVSEKFLGSFLAYVDGLEPLVMSVE